MKIKKIITLVFMLALTLCTLTINLSAKTIVIEKDEDLDDNTGYVLNNSYSIFINEDNNIGYLERNINGNSVVLGTCKVIIIDVSNPEGYILCNDDNNSLGTITILINSNNEEKGTIVNLNGEISSINFINEEVSILKKTKHEI